MTDHQLTPDATELLAPIVYGTINGGLRRDQLLGDNLNVQLTVGPWDFPTLTDVIVLHWGTLWARDFPVTTVSGGGQPLFVPGIDIAGQPLPGGDHYTGEGTHAVWYEVRTASGEVTPSATTSVEVKTARPGSEDPRPDTPVNDNLDAPVAVPASVEADTPSVTFTVAPWTNIAMDDCLTLVFAGYPFPFPPITDVTANQTLVLTAAQMAPFGSGEETPITYEILDRVHNQSGFAPYLLLDIWLEDGDLLEPLMLLDGEDKPIAGAISPAMTGAKARIPRYPGWAVGEKVHVEIRGVDRNDQPHDTTLGPATWDSGTFYLDVALPNTVLAPLAGGLLRVYYRTAANHSRRRVYLVDALPETGLPPVVVLHEANNELILDNIPGNEVNIVVPDSDGLVEFARVTLRMDGTAASGPVLEEATYNIGEGEGHVPLTFAWAKERVARLLDATATFRYSVRTLDAAPQGQSAGPRLYRRPLSLRGIRDSEPHDLLIRQSGGGAELKAPIVHDLVDDVLSPTRPSVRLTVPGGAESKPGRKVTTTVVGRTTVSRTNTIFDQGESLAVDFAGWPALNDGAYAIASYVIEGVSASPETRFRVGGSSQPFTLDDSLVQLKVGDDYRREASGGTPPYTYSSNATAVAVPQADDGLIRGARAGSASISVKDSAQGAGQYPVVVTADNPFDISPDPVSIDTDTDYTRNATGGTPPYSYTSSAPSIVRVPESDYGLVRGIAPGNATIIARDQANASGSYQVTVTNATPPFHIDPSQVDLTPTEHYTRNATGGTPPYIYTSNQPNIVSVPDHRVGDIVAKAAGNTIISVSDSAKGHGFYPVTVSEVTPPFFSDLTDFTNMNWNGWVKGTASSHPQCTIILESGNYMYRNMTPGDFGGNMGMLLTKRFTNLFIGARYVVSLLIRNHHLGASEADPNISISTSDGTILGPRVITEHGWVSLVAAFVATAQTMDITLNSHESQGYGNDFDIDNISVQTG